MKIAAVAIALVCAAPLAAATRAARLSRDVVPTRYAVTFAPDLAHGTFSGREAIDVELERASSSITLHADGLDIVDARVTAGGETQEARTAIDEARQTLTLVLARPLAAGPARIVLGWSSPLEDDLVGFYRAEAHGRRYALTHFEPAGARRAFPCFDDPAFKARFAVTAVVDAGDDAISNAPVAAVTTLPGGSKLVQFAETPPLPTYLVALAVGRFAARSRVVDGVTIRMLAPPEDVARGNFALDVAARLLPRFVSWFGAAYPFAKLDLVAVPALVPGGMENAGAIFLRDDRVLAQPELAAPTELRDVERLVAHELAHQWLGDLVTPSWWDDLWLNEATANFAANEVLAIEHPARAPWLEFQPLVDDVLADDELPDARPVRSRIADTHAARDAFDGMTYIKGAAVLRMIDAWLGAGSVRRALADDIARHRFGNTDADAFFAALDGAAGGRAASDVLRAWLERSGHPLVDVSARCDHDTATVTLTQAPLAGAGIAPPWPIPVGLRWPGGARTLVVTAHATTLTLPGCPAWLDANAARAGFYRVRYAAPLATALAATAARELDSAERVGLISDAWSDVRAGSASPSQFLSLVTALRGEPSPVVLGEIARRLSFIDEELLPAEARDAFARYVAAEVAPQYRALGLMARPTDDEDTRLLRAVVIDLLGRVARLPAVDAAADRAALAWFADQRSLDPALAPVVLQLAARHDDGSRFRQLVTRLKGTRSPDEQRLYLTALTGFERPSLLKRTLALLLTPAVPAQDLTSLVAGLMAQGRGESLTAWDFLRHHFDAVAERMPRLGWLLAPAAQLCDERSARQVTRFFGALGHGPTVPERLHQTEEAIAECVALRRRTAAPLVAWLRARQRRTP